MPRPQHGPEFHKSVFRRLSADPAGSVGGDAYFNTIANAVRMFNGTIWQSFTAAAASAYPGALVAAGAGSAGQPSASVKPHGGLASGTGTAYNATVVHVP